MVVHFSPDIFHVDNFRGGAGQTHEIPPRKYHNTTLSYVLDFSTKPFLWAIHGLFCRISKGEDER